MAWNSSGVTMEYADGLMRQVFWAEYFYNGIFPSRSDIVKSIRSETREWNFNNKFEYRMLLDYEGTGVTIPSAGFSSTGQLQLTSEQTVFGVFMASYGQISEGFTVDMTANLETEEKQASFNNDLSTRLHRARLSMSKMYRNYAIHGRFGVVHRINTDDIASIVANQKAGTGLVVSTTPATAGSIQNMSSIMDASGAPKSLIRLQNTTPSQVFHSNMKYGTYLIKTQNDAGAGAGPSDWKGSTGAYDGKSSFPFSSAKTSEVYMVVENKMHTLVLVPVPGTTPTAWYPGQYLELYGNRHPLATGDAGYAGPGLGNAAGLSVQSKYQLTNLDSRYTGLTVGTANPAGVNVGTEYSSGYKAVTGAMEGMADLFPWYSSNARATPSDNDNRDAALQFPFRNQASRFVYEQEMAGSIFFQEDNENIIDAVMRGVQQVFANIPFSDIRVWFNPDTREQISYEEGGDIKVIRKLDDVREIKWQRGVDITSYQVSGHLIPDALSDFNLPTDVVVIGPTSGIKYAAWGNTYAQIDDYIKSTFSHEEDPMLKAVDIPKEVLTKLDLGNRMVYYSPTTTDDMSMLSDANAFLGGGFIHPKDVMPVKMTEMGTLFTEYPHHYAIVKLRKPIIIPGREQTADFNWGA